MNDTSIRRPAMPLYVSDFVDSESVALMPLEAVGVYIKLLCYNWKNRSIPADLDQLATLLRLNARTLRRIWPHLAPKFRLKDASDPTRLTNERVEKEIKRADEKSEKSRNAAESRHTDHADAGADAMPRGRASSVSSSSAVPEEKIKIPPGGGSASPPASPALQSQRQQVLSGVPTQPPPEDKAPAKPKAPPADVGRVIQRYCALWVETYKPEDGRAPKLDKVDRYQGAQLVRDHGVDRALLFLERYFGDADPWLVDHCHPLASITRQVNKYRATVQLPVRDRFAPKGPAKERRNYSRDADDVLREQRAKAPEPSQAELRARQTGAAT
jgi:uncharacterized protein YdaU (DUF1376 family)